MSKPDWFILIAEWRRAGMGAVGPTLPFLVGALAYKAKRSNLKSDDVRHVLNAMIEDPVEDYVTQVSWCPNIDAPVFTMARLSAGSDTRPEEWPMELPSYFVRPDGKARSLGFSDNLHSEIQGLGCNNERACFEKLVLNAERRVKEATYSRVRCDNGTYTDSAFTARDLEYIRSTIM